MIDEMIGKIFGRLTVLEFDHVNKWRSKCYKCECSCERKTIKIISGKNLRNGTTKSCGCLQKEIVSLYKKEHKTKKKDKLENYTKDKNGFIVKENYLLDSISFIYKLTNKINNKIYFGQTKGILKNLLKRYNKLINTKKNFKRYIDRALIKYGLSNFEFEIIEFCDKNNLNDREIFYIASTKSNDPKIGYNCTAGGDGFSGYIFTEEHKKHISESRMGKFMGKDNSFFGKKHTPETILKIIESNKKRGKNYHEKFS